MKSVADQLRVEGLLMDAQSSFPERLRNAHASGERDVRLLAAARRISDHEARILIGRQRQHGRLRSACHLSLFV